MDQVIAIGTSAGGREALCAVIEPLAADLAAPVLVVQHIGSWPSAQPSFLDTIAAMPVAYGNDGELLRAGRIYVAPPDHHMLVHRGTIELTRGPRENYARPAVDPLFRSAAAAYGAGAIGVVLTGNLNDGTAGLYELKRQGGIAIVQNPEHAQAPSMPRSAWQNVPIDYCLPLDAIGGALTRLVRERRHAGPIEAPGPGEDPMARDMRAPAEPTALVCPECGGALRPESRGGLLQFRCHIGHRMSAEVLAAAQVEVLERNAAELPRLLNERMHLCREMAARHRTQGRTETARVWEAAEREAQERMETVASIADAQWTRPEAV